MSAAVGLALLLAGGFPRVGVATHYAPGLAEQVYAYRLETGQVAPCPASVGYAALLEPEALGRRVWIELAGQAIGPLLVVDMAQTDHRANLVARGWVVDLDYATAAAWGLADGGPLRRVVVFAADPRLRRAACGYLKAE